MQGEPSGESEEENDKCGKVQRTQQAGVLRQKLDRDSGQGEKLRSQHGPGCRAGWAAEALCLLS